MTFNMTYLATIWVMPRSSPSPFIEPRMASRIFSAVKRPGGVGAKGHLLLDFYSGCVIGISGRFHEELLLLRLRRRETRVQCYGKMIRSICRLRLRLHQLPAANRIYLAKSL